MLSIILAYTSEDQHTAATIVADVGSHVEIELVPISRANEGETLAYRLREWDRPSVVLVSHHFLTNPNCLLGAYDVFARQQDVLPVLVDGERYDELLDEEVREPLSLDNQAAVMTYVNHWQDRYLDLRAQADDLRIEGGESFDRYLRKIRESSAQVEETLNLIKDGWHLQLGQFRANDYQQLFLFAERPRLWEDYRDRDRALPELSEIPGIAALPKLTDRAANDEADTGDDRSDDARTADQDAPTNEEGSDAAEEHSGDAARVQSELEEAVEEEPVPGQPSPAPNLTLIPNPDYSQGEDSETSLEDGTTEANDEELEAEEQAIRWIQRAWQLYDKGEEVAGRALLETGREALPDNADLSYQYALYQATSLDELAPALRTLDELLASQPIHPDALYLRGELRAAGGQTSEARADWENLVEIEPLYPEVNYRLGLLIVDHFPNDGPEALTYLRRAAKESPNNADVLFQYGRQMHEVTGRAKKATKILRKAVKADPDHAAAHFELATVYLERNKYAAARNAYLIAARLDPAFDTPFMRTSFLTPPEPEDDQDFSPVLTADHQQDEVADLRRALQAATAAAASKESQLLDDLAALHEQLSEQAADLARKADELRRLQTPPPGPGAGKIVLISGATSGIGKATAIALAADGYHLILTGRRAARLREIQEELKERYPIDCYVLCFDVRDRRAVVEAIGGLPVEWRRIDVLINNAGKAKGFDPIHTGDYDHWEEMIDVNLKGLLYLTREVSPLMVEHQRGTIINVCSTAGKEVYPNGNVYCATKHAVDALTHAMRLDLVEHGIRVGQVCPAHVEETEFAVVRFDGDTERAQIYEGFQPLRASDVGEMVRYMIGRPRHVNLLDVVMQGTQQASSTVINRSGRAEYAPEEE